MTDSLSRDRRTRAMQTWVIGAGLVLVVLFVLRGVLLPDTVARNFDQARRLEDLGQLEQARRIYDLIYTTHPQSEYAPRALDREASILAEMARSGGQADLFRQAIATYQKLAANYPNDDLAGDALMSAGSIALKEINDTTAAKQIYNQLLTEYSDNDEYAAEATLQIGAIALVEGDGKTAQQWLQRVGQHYPTMTDRCAEALYDLGVTYETLFKNQDWAIDAYRATIEKYSKTVWATNAQERLGLIEYNTNGYRPARRVMITTAPLPDSGTAQDSVYSALLPLLAARGITPSDDLLRGWSLSPFYAGFSAEAPAHVFKQPSDELLTNVAACVGLNYSKQNFNDEKKAIADLLTSIDFARPPIVYNGQWTLAVGYDSQSDELMTQGHGARVDVTPWTDFLSSWKKTSPMGGSYTLLSFWAPGDRSHSAIATPTPTTAADATAPVSSPATGQPPLTVPTYNLDLAKLSAQDADRRALRSAVALMQESRDDNGYLNLAALDEIVTELNQLGESTPVRQDQAPSTEQGNSAGNSAAGNSAAGASPVTPADRTLAKTQALLGWFGVPLKHWVEQRRDAASFLDAAGDALGDSRLHDAAALFRKSCDALQAAAAAAPSSSQISDDGATLNDTAKTALANVAQQVQAAHDDESQAVEAMKNSSR